MPSSGVATTSAGAILETTQAAAAETTVPNVGDPTTKSLDTMVAKTGPTDKTTAVRTASVITTKAAKSHNRPLHKRPQKAVDRADAPTDSNNASPSHLSSWMVAVIVIVVVGVAAGLIAVVIFVKRASDRRRDANMATRYALAADS